MHTRTHTHTQLMDYVTKGILGSLISESKDNRVSPIESNNKDISFTKLDVDISNPLVWFPRDCSSPNLLDDSEFVKVDLGRITVSTEPSTEPETGSRMELMKCCARRMCVSCSDSDSIIINEFDLSVDVRTPLEPDYDRHPNMKVESKISSLESKLKKSLFFSLSFSLSSTHTVGGGRSLFIFFLYLEQG